MTKPAKLIKPKVLDKTSWPPDYPTVHEWRSAKLEIFKKDPAELLSALEYYKKPEHWAEFICHWVDTFDPRNAGGGQMTRLPLVLFKKQAELVEFLNALVRDQESGLIDKSRDMGATWVCCAFSICMWLFVEGASIGWGSRKQELVDKLGDMDSIFEKLRQLIRGLPKEFLPVGFSYSRHMSFERILNPENGASITGEVGDNIGRGGRKSMYFKDESAHYEHPELIEAALGDNTRVQVDISTPNGVGTVYDRKKESAIEWKPGQKCKPGYTQMLVMDWSDHPTKTPDWYKTREAKFKREGLIHIFRQEVDRNPAASLVGVIIPFEWVNAAVDAHAKLGFGISGGKMGSLDVADEGGDLNALTMRQGVVLTYAEDFPGDEEGVGKSARYSIGVLNERGCKIMQYDCCGIGAGVKSEASRLAKEKKLPLGFQVIPWDAGAGPQNPKIRLVPGDKESPTNEDFYCNLKAQGWWSLRRRFEKTYQMITEPYIYKYKFDELISLPSNLPNLSRIKRELSQPTIVYDGSMRIKVDKKPEGAKSPNLGDSIMQNYFPLQGKLIISPRMAQMAKTSTPARFTPAAVQSGRDQVSQFT